MQRLLTSSANHRNHAGWPLAVVHAQNFDMQMRWHERSSGDLWSPLDLCAKGRREARYIDSQSGEVFKLW